MITKELINSEVEKLRKELLAKLEEGIIKPVVGKWYKELTCEALYCIVELDKNTIKNYGFNYEGKWMNLDTRYLDSDWLTEIREATPSEVQSALEAEAVKKYKTGDTFKCLVTKSNVKIDFEKRFDYYIKEDDLSNNGMQIYKQGKWATIIKEKTSEEWVNEFLKNENYALDQFAIFLEANNLKITKK